jgi:CHAD domain-containing protein
MKKNLIATLRHVACNMKKNYATLSHVACNMRKKYTTFKNNIRNILKQHPQHFETHLRHPAILKHPDLLFQHLCKTLATTTLAEAERRPLGAATRVPARSLGSGARPAELRRPEPRGA